MSNASPHLTAEQEVLRQRALLYLPFQLTAGQQHTLDKLCRFSYEAAPRDVFVLNGFAGTGKTSLMGAYVRAMHSIGKKVVLLAPTGRAAKVFSSFSGLPASTVHRRLYRPTGEPGQMRFTLAPNKLRDAIFVVDEASLIGDNADIRHSLLLQLIRYVYSSAGCRLILMGDTAQLPPVGMEESRAMSCERLKNIGLSPISVTLTETVRQASESGILMNATLVRHFITGEVHPQHLQLKASQFPEDVVVVTGEELEDYYTSSLSKVGHEGTIVITRSNWRANAINHDIRFRILDAEQEIGSGEKLLITRNNYYWARKQRNSLLANGDMATVAWIGHTEERFGLRFADAELMLPGRDEPIAAKLMLSTLEMQTTNLPMSGMAELEQRILKDAESLARLNPAMRFKLVENDPYFNALQIKHAYCITCHKAQGGQWKHVYIDMAGIRSDDFGPEFYRWLYTAITRATERIFLVNPTLPVV